MNLENQTNHWLQLPAANTSEESRQAAELRQAKLTKPPGSLGAVESIAIQLAAMQHSDRPGVDRLHITVFAADHGVTAAGISAFPQAVTAEMVRNFSSGGAAISVLAKTLGANLEVVNLGTVAELEPLPGVLNCRLGPGTNNFCHAASMDEHQLTRALQAGREAVKRALQANSQLFIGGEMGIGNTTSAAALGCALLDTSPTELAGPGTGLDTPGVLHKAEVIRQALDYHQGQLVTALSVLQHLGGFEIAALAGSYVACAQQGLPVLVDGFISSTAALVATRLCPGVGDWLLFSHTSAEPGHRIILEALSAKPILNLAMRLGEGSGSAMAVPILRLACALHNEMATFNEAGVSAGPC